MIQKAMEYLIEKINKELEIIQIRLADDDCRDFGEYKKACGEVKGLLTVRNMCQDLHKRAEEYDE
jgi:hypothetical protein